MSGQVHQLFAGDADRDAAWNRYVKLVQDLEDRPELRTNRDHIDRMLGAFAEYRRLFDLQLERGGKS